MTDVLRVVATPGGPSLLDLNDVVTFARVADSFTITPGASTVLSSETDGRYEGSRVDYEDRGNGTITWQAVIRGQTSSQAGASLARLAAELERADPPGTRYVEYRPDGWATSVFYERRGPGTWSQVDRWPDQRVLVFDVSLPVAPVAYGVPVTVTPAGQSLPAVFALGQVPGTLAAKADVTLAIPAVPNALVWGLLAPFQGPYGVLEAEAVTGGSVWTATAAADARGGSMLSVAAGAGGNNFAQWQFDPSAVTIDAAEYEQDVAVEVWARIGFPGTVTLVASAAPPGLGAARYTVDYGPAGRQATGGGGGWLLHRVGTLIMPTDPGAWTITVGVSPQTAGNLNFDYALLVPARRRACSPTGVPADAAYPAFAPSNAALTKRVRRDLSGSVSVPGGVLHADTGLGGAPLRVPPGASSLLVAASPAVPDDPNPPVVDALGPSTSLTVTILPRYRLLDVPS